MVLFLDNMCMLKARAFTLIELLITMAVVGVLAAIAIPSYQSYMQKARRADAHAALGRVLIEQEKYRVTHTAYASSLEDDLELKTSSPDGHYAISIVNNDSTGFKVKATPANAQEKDSVCSSITLELKQGGIVEHKPDQCWSN
jgi:type IV pilus assembly protein PilE